jgi:hypothetical protein
MELWTTRISTSFDFRVLGKSGTCSLDEKFTRFATETSLSFEPSPSWISFDFFSLLPAAASAGVVQMSGVVFCAARVR